MDPNQPIGPHARGSGLAPFTARARRSGSGRSAGMPEAPAERTAKPLLLIEDDRELCALMSEYFAQHQLRIEAVHDGGEGLSRALGGDYELVILDVMLPVLDGFEVLRQLRKRRETPVIMLTARTAPSDRVQGLDTGADDYLPKPFDPEELLARIRAVLRRGRSVDSAGRDLEAGGVRLDPRSREASLFGQAIQVTSIEFDILETLVRAAGRTVSRDEMTAALHQRRSTPYERSLDVHISHLRKKLARDGVTPIRTIRGVGYQFAPASEVEP
jgi:two-component system, OmpR family, response regulator CpxR